MCITKPKNLTSMIISSVSGVLVCLSLSSRLCLTSTLQSSAVCCAEPCSVLPGLVLLLLVVVLELRSALGLATVVDVGSESERLGVTDDVRTVTVKDGALFRASVTDDPVLV